MTRLHAVTDGHHCWVENADTGCEVLTSITYTPGDHARLVERVATLNADSTIQGTEDARAALRDFQPAPTAPPSMLRTFGQTASLMNFDPTTQPRS